LKKRLGSNRTRRAGAGGPTGDGRTRRSGSGRQFRHRLRSQDQQRGVPLLLLSAVRYADGTPTGEAQAYQRALDGFAHIAIDSLERLPNNRAHMSGTVTETSDPAVLVPGEYVHFTVEDNGEGGAAPPDRVTGIPENEPVRCDSGQLPSSNFSKVLRRNVQIR